MFAKTKVATLAMLVSVVLATAPLMFLAQGQVQSAPAEQVVTIAKRAEQQVQNLIDMINADEEALDKIDTADLTREFEENVELFATGSENLKAAQASLENSDYQAAVDSAVKALKVFRDVYSSIHVILAEAGIQKGDLIENQGLLEAITRELQRIDRLREILPDDVTQEILNLLDSAKTLLNEAKTLLLSGDVTEARAKFLEAKESIAKVYQHLKAQAEKSNEWRLRDYCEGLQERIRERFRYGQEQEIDFTSLLQSYGYKSENQYMVTLQNRIQTAQSKQNFGEAVQNCAEVSQMVQQMEQALNQEINRQQGQKNPGPSGSGSTSGYSGNGRGP